MIDKVKKDQNNRAITCPSHSQNFEERYYLT